MKRDAESRQGVHRPNRRSIRLPGYDYSQAGAYFVTICTKDRKCLFGDIVKREMVLNDAGQMVNKWYGELENKFSDIKCDQYTIMPNHFHAIIQNVGANLGVRPNDEDPRVCPTDPRVCPNGKRAAGPHAAGDNTFGEHTAGEHMAGEHIGSPLPRVIQWFKTMITNEYIRGVKQHDWRHP